MPRQPFSVRQAAAAAYAVCNRDVPRAKREFDRKVRNHGIKNAYEYVKYWGERFLDIDQNLQLNDKPRSGRPSKLTADDGKAISDALLSGGQGSYKTIGYPSFIEAAKDHSTINSILTSKNVSPKTALRAAQQQNPNLVHKQLLSLKSPLTVIHKRKRVKGARVLKRKPWHYHQRTLSLDSKRLASVPLGKLKTWRDKRQTDFVIEDSRLKMGSKDIKVLNYYAVVNPVIGPVYLQFVTGTQGLKTNFKVSPFL